MDWNEMEFNSVVENIIIIIQMSQVFKRNWNELEMTVDVFLSFLSPQKPHFISVMQIDNVVWKKELICATRKSDEVNLTEKSRLEKLNPFPVCNKSR